MKFPSFIQYNTKDCGPSCLKIISKYYGQEYSLAYLRELCQVSRDGTSISSMRDAAEKLGYDVSVTKMSWKTLNLVWFNEINNFFYLGLFSVAISFESNTPKSWCWF